VIHLLPSHLLRRHVADLADDRPRISVNSPRSHIRRDFVPARRSDQLDDAEGEYLHPTITCYEEVLRLEIAVHGTLLTCGG
jgi:hypothetical protein